MYACMCVNIYLRMCWSVNICTYGKLCVCLSMYVYIVLIYVEITRMRKYVYMLVCVSMRNK
jgi:hypothetical protein